MLSSSLTCAAYSEAIWVKYAKWEESQKDFARARSVWWGCCTTAPGGVRLLHGLDWLSSPVFLPYARTGLLPLPGWCQIAYVDLYWVSSSGVLTAK